MTVPTVLYVVSAVLFAAAVVVPNGALVPIGLALFAVAHAV